MVSHSLCQGVPGFAIFPQAIYKYIITGDLKASVEEISLDDVSHSDLRKTIKEVCILYLIPSKLMLLFDYFGPKISDWALSISSKTH